MAPAVEDDTAAAERPPVQYNLSGPADDEDFAQAEYLCEMLMATLPHASCHITAVLPEEWPGYIEKKCATLDQLLAVLNPIQRKWVYLEPIFGRGAMPHEQARFRRVDDEFRALMSSIVDDPRVFSVLKVPQLVT